MRFLNGLAFIFAFIWALQATSAAANSTCTIRVAPQSSSVLTSRGTIPSRGATLALQITPSSGAQLFYATISGGEADVTLASARIYSNDSFAQQKITIEAIEQKNGQQYYCSSLILYQDGVMPARCYINVSDRNVLIEGKIPQQGGKNLLSFSVNPLGGAAVAVTSSPNGSVEANRSEVPRTRTFRATVKDNDTQQPGYCTLNLTQEALSPNCCLCSNSTNLQCTETKADFLRRTGTDLCFSACEVPNLADDSNSENRFLVREDGAYRKGYTPESHLGFGFRSEVGSENRQCFNGTTVSSDLNQVRYRLEITGRENPYYFTIRLAAFVLKREQKLTGITFKDSRYQRNPQRYCGDSFIKKVQLGGRLQFELGVQPNNGQHLAAAIPSILEVGDNAQDIAYFTSVLSILNQELNNNFTIQGTGVHISDPRSVATPELLQNLVSLPNPGLSTSSTSPLIDDVLTRLQSYTKTLKALDDAQILSSSPQQYVFVVPITPR